VRLKEADHPFYRRATFYTFEELGHLLAGAGLVTRRVSSAITRLPGGTLAVEEVFEGLHPAASFVGILARAE